MKGFSTMKLAKKYYIVIHHISQIIKLIYLGISNRVICFIKAFKSKKPLLVSKGRLATTILERFGKIKKGTQIYESYSIVTKKISYIFN